MDDKILSRINAPSDLAGLSCEEKKALAAEIRRELLSVVSQTGGHLASNLGVVELTIALHSVFGGDAEIVWDVGHQSYVHKMLTGRRERLAGIRTMGGLSGFPKRAESEFDVFDTGHSSTSVSAATGLAIAERMNGGKKHVIAVIGDGALTGGMAYEALNHLGHIKENVKIVFNDNEMSISKNVGGFVNSLRASAGYTKIKKGTKNFLGKVPIIGAPVARAISALKRAFRTLFVGSGQMFEDFGIKYLGRVDGHDIKKLESAFSSLRDYEGPAVIHVRTVKGRGYAPAEALPELYHGVGKFDPSVGVSSAPAPANKDFSAAFGAKLVEMSTRHGDIVAISAAMIDGTGLAEMARAYPDRVYDVGIAEQHAVTLAAGIALGGGRPFVAIYSTFLQRAYDQVLHDVCIQRAPVVFCIDRAGLVGADGETHQGIFDISYLSHIPRLAIYSVANYEQLRAAMEAAYAHADGPVAIRYPRGAEIELKCAYEDIASGRIVSGAGASNEHIYEENATNAAKQSPARSAHCENAGTDAYAGKAEARSAARVVILTTGRAAAVAGKVVEILRSRYAFAAEALCVVQIRPFSAAVEEFIRGFDYIFTIEDHAVRGGFGDLVQSAARLSAAVVKFGFDDFVAHGSVDELYELNGLSPDFIAAKVAEILELE